MKKIFLKAWKRMALNNFVSGNFEKSEKFFLKLIKNDVEYDKMKFNLGLTQLAQKKYDKAEDNFLYMLSQYGDSYEVLKTLGDFYYIWGKAKLADEYYTKALRKCLNDKDRVLISKRKEKCKSDKSFRKVINAHSSFDLGNQCLKEHDYEKSKKAFKHVVDNDETNYHALNNLGVIYLNKYKDPDRALMFFEKAYKLSDIPALAMNIKKAKQYKAEINI